MANNDKKNNNNNPRNPQAPLFKKLTRLLSGPLVSYRQQNPRQLRRRQLDKFKFKSASGQQFKKSAYNPFASLQANYMVNQNRGDRYVDFDQMEFMPEIASAMDIYADEMTTSTDLSPLLTIDCPNEEIKSILSSLYKKTLNIEFNLFGWCRTMCKYGDFFLYLDIDEEFGVRNVVGLPSHEVERLEGEDETNPEYVQYQWNSGGLTFENWQIAHFRVLGNDKYAPYGTSILEAARRIWRQLTLIEDAMMAYRIVRSPERRVFYIDVGNIPAPDVEQYMQKVVTQMKRNQVIDPDTGRVDLRYNPMSIDEDYFIPLRGGNSSRVETLPGGTYTGDIDDVKYLRDKLFAALKVPQSYLSRGEGSEEDKTTLAQKDIRFARTIQRLQRSVVAELEKVAIVHLYTLGYRNDDLVSFKISLNNPSRIAELQELEHWRTKFETAAAATEGFFSRRWVSKNVFKMSDQEIVRNHREMFFDAKLQAGIQAIAEMVQQEAAGLGGGLEGAGDDLGDDLGDEEELGGEELGGEELGGEELGGEEPAPAEMGGDEESPLLSTPGNRDVDKVIFKDGTTTTVASKDSIYNPISNQPGRRDGREVRSPRKKNYMKHSGVQQGGRKNIFKTGRANLFKGDGYYDADLVKGLFEEIESNYKEVEEKEEENRLFEVKQEIRDLIIELDNKNMEHKK